MLPNSIQPPFSFRLQRPKSAYFFYLDDVRAQVKSENPNKGVGDLAKIMGAMWNEIKETKEADKYNKKAQEDKARYEREKKEKDGGGSS